MRISFLCPEIPKNNVYKGVKRSVLERNENDFFWKKVYAQDQVIGKRPVVAPPYKAAKGAGD
jgi:hypothetical protein